MIKETAATQTFDVCFFLFEVYASLQSSLFVDSRSRFAECSLKFEI